MGESAPSLPRHAVAVAALIAWLAVLVLLLAGSVDGGAGVLVGLATGVAAGFVARERWVVAVPVVLGALVFTLAIVAWGDEPRQELGLLGFLLVTVGLGLVGGAALALGVFLRTLWARREGPPGGPRPA